MTHLYTFWVSHFSEKARFALEFEGVPFQERALLPGPHAFKIRALTRQQQVPVLEHGRSIVHGSGAILDALPGLFGVSRLQPWCGGGADPALQQAASAWETRLDDAIGRGVQAIAYDVLLRHPTAIIQLWNWRGPWWGRAFYALTYPALASVIRKQYSGGPERVAAAKAAFIAMLQTTDEVVSRENYLLGGTAPSRVDIALAALLAPMCRPPEHPMKWPAHVPELADFIGPFEDSPTLQFVRRMYREHRRQAEPVVNAAG